MALLLRDAPGDDGGLVMKAPVWVVLPLLLLAAPAGAETSADAEIRWAAKDRVVCRDGEVPGTRKGRVKVCMTASEWKYNKKLAREAVELKQRESLQLDPHG